MRKLAFAFLAAAILLPSLQAQELSAADLDRRRKALSDLLAEHWQYTLRTNPEFASMLGDKRYNDRLSDPSPAAIEKDLAETKKYLRRFQAIDARGFSEQERLNRALMIALLSNSIEDARFRTWMMPVTQRSGVHLSAAQFPSLLTFTTVKDYDDFIARMKQIPRVFDEVTANMRRGMSQRLMPPKFLLEKVAEQAGEMTKQEPQQTPFARPIATFSAGISEEEQVRIRRDWLETIRTSVLPAYAKFAQFVREEYAPKGRTDVGVWSLPDGAARYANRVRRMTTTDLTPDEIHAIGLREVARIEGEMLEIAKKLGFSDLKSFNLAIESNPALRAKSGEEILEEYRTYIGQMYEKLPELFGRLPRAKVEVVATPEFRAKTAAAADYNAPAPDGSRPGRINVNTHDATSRKTITNESTAYHEGVPGHHMQIAIAQELPNIPEFRRQGGYTPFIEGWALYSERLGKEVGFYQDPYKDYGRLQDEMLRAIRLVVDTGLHHKRWTREQVVQYFRDHSAIDEVDIQSETDRYISWPGQALAYKIGQMKISELRAQAQRELGDQFDIRAFHDEVLGAGALPLTELETRITRWLGAKM
ncbi:MAG TPA: DUF885 domain-containing protein [Thermoanaerobaculia bacterium]|nr:DUF885 domain-containing protein [Thermoanaerobaculia bacterium]